MKLERVFLMLLVLVIISGTLIITGSNQAIASKQSSKVVKMFKKLKVESDNVTGYKRTLFPHWSDLDRNGCDTRQDVLYRENLRRKGTCNSKSGKWVSLYDGAKTNNPTSFDIDHMVPLSEAWKSGANKWTTKKREKYANDMYAYSLIAVTASSNRSKGDRDPASWMPPAKQFQCQYIARWIAIKYRWKLSMDKKEKRSLKFYIRSCPEKKLKLTKKIKISTNPDSSTNKPAKGLDPRFSTCKEAIKHGYGNYKKGVNPEYEWYRDSDGDGIACEK